MTTQRKNNEARVADALWNLDYVYWRMDYDRIEPVRMPLSTFLYTPSVEGESMTPDLPIILIMNECGQSILLDGQHRVAKAIQQGDTTIPAYCLSYEYADALRVKV